MQRLIPPWEYRHRYCWAGVRIAAGSILVMQSETQHGKTRNRGPVCHADGSHHRCGGFAVLQTPVLGTVAGEYRHCPGVRSILFAIPEASMKT